MPILPPFAAQVQDTVNDVLTATKARLGDDITTLEPTGGSLLGNGSIFSQQVVNNAWRKLQEFLANIGYTALKQEGLVQGLPVVATLDPGIPCWVDWYNTFDGANLFDNPTVPQDMILPLKIWERPTGQNYVFPPDPMELCFDGLRSTPKTLWNGQWEWRANQIYFPGAMQSMDFRILYMRYLGDFDDEGNVQWFQQPVPLVRCQNAFSGFICAELAETRQEIDGEKWLQRAEADARRMANREISMKQRGNVRRMSRSGRLEGNSGNYDGY